MSSIDFFKKLFVNNFGLFTYKKPELEYVNHPEYSLDSLSKISEKIEFGWMGGFENERDFYFDNKNLYIVNTETSMAIFRLSEIVSLKSMRFQILNKPLWQITIQHEGVIMNFRILVDRGRLSNGNFDTFWETIKSLNLNAVEKGWSLFW